MVQIKLKLFSVDDNYTTTIIVSESPLVEVSKVEEGQITLEVM